MTIPSQETQQFTTIFDPTSPLDFIQSTFEFIAQQSPGFFRRGSTINGIANLINYAATTDFPKPSASTTYTASPISSAAISGSSPKSDASVAEENQMSKFRDNGLDLEKYTWGQTRKKVTVTVPLPPGTKPRFLSNDVKKNHMKIGLEGQPPIIYGELSHFVIPDECYWSLEDQKTLTVFLRKRDKTDWWRCLVKGEPEIDIEKVVPEELDLETRLAEEKMMFDERQKAMGLPTSDEMRKEEMLNAFYAQHPRMSFPNAKFSGGMGM